MASRERPLTPPCAKGELARELPNPIMRLYIFVCSCALVMASAPAPVTAQFDFLVGGGLTTPIGDFSESAGSGYHARAGLQVGLPTIPVALRLDVAYHRLSEADPTFEPPDILRGAIDVVYELPGVGLMPYLLVGLARNRLNAGPVGMSRTVYRNGFNAGFGVAVGSGAFGGFLEIRYVQVAGETSANKYVPVSVGLRF
jgi:hypothetical protein